MGGRPELRAAKGEASRRALPPEQLAKNSAQAWDLVVGLGVRGADDNLVFNSESSRPGSLFTRRSPATAVCVALPIGSCSIRYFIQMPALSPPFGLVKPRPQGRRRAFAPGAHLSPARLQGVRHQAVGMRR